MAGGSGNNQLYGAGDNDYLLSLVGVDRL
ncbi:MAG TPA: hypothetical protein VKB53_02330 [Gammaproteobacteria bacterium]|nr:hypothetical protein [Gammaproteobacteria bacterium]